VAQAQPVAQAQAQPVAAQEATEQAQAQPVAQVTPISWRERNPGTGTLPHTGLAAMPRQATR
jgi:hypothetical protein